MKCLNSNQTQLRPGQLGLGKIVVSDNWKNGLPLTGHYKKWIAKALMVSKRLYSPTSINSFEDDCNKGNGLLTNKKKKKARLEHNRLADPKRGINVLIHFYFYFFEW